MKLIDVQKCGKYKYVGCLDSDMIQTLFAYGFYEGAEIEVLMQGKFGYVVEVLGTKFSVNSNLAKIILLKSMV